MSSHHKHNHQDQAQAVIESIAHREQELQSELDLARQQAARMIEDARIKADGIFKTTRQEIETVKVQHQRQMELESLKIMEERLKQAEGDLEILEKKAAENRDKAVKAVLNYVLPGEKS